MADNIASAVPQGHQFREQMIRIVRQDIRHAGGIARAYRFTKQEPRALSPERLQAQLNAAGYIATTPKEIGALKPT